MRPSFETGDIADLARVDRVRGGIRGSFAPAFAPVAQAFVDNFVDRYDAGAACSVFFEGQKVVDLWGGYADPAQKKRWERDTLQLVFSTTKGMLALLCAVLHDEGVLDYDAPVSDVWPAFGAAGKSAITVRTLLQHQAGLAALPQSVTLEELSDLDHMAGRIAPLTPAWEPGAAVGYHVWTYGMYVGEYLRRLTGKDAATLFREKIAAPFGVDFHMVLDDEGQSRRSTVVRPPVVGITRDIAPFLFATDRREIPFMLRSTFLRGSLAAKAMGVVPELGAASIDKFNLPQLGNIVLGSAIGFSTARALARVYGALATDGVLDGKRLLSRATLDKICGAHARGIDQVLSKENAFSYGFGRNSIVNTYGRSDRSFGFGGAGGSVSFADPDVGVGFSWIMNRMWYRFADPRFLACRNAVYAALERTT